MQPGSINSPGDGDSSAAVAAATERERELTRWAAIVVALGR